MDRGLNTEAIFYQSDPWVMHKRINPGCKEHTIYITEKVYLRNYKKVTNGENGNCNNTGQIRKKKYLFRSTKIKISLNHKELPLTIR